MKLAQFEGIDQLGWHERIHSNPKVLGGKPVVRGTRLSVELILDLFADGWTEQMILDNYPRLTKEDLRAVFAFAADSARDQRIVEVLT